MRVVAIVQARMGSTRLPNKVLKTICGQPMIGLLLARLSCSREIHEIVVATSRNPRNVPLIECVENLGYSCVKGSESDVLERYVEAAEKHRADIVVRITGDCPLIDPELVDETIQKFIEGDYDYYSNTNPPTFPDGLDVEVFSRKVLSLTLQCAKEKFDRENVTPYMRTPNLFKQGTLKYKEDHSSLRWTVDEYEDFVVVSRIFNHFYPNIYFSWKEILTLQREKPQLFSANQSIIRNEGAIMGTGQKLWKRAQRIIPGGNMLLSKRPEMFLPDQWPSYFARAKGCKIWDLDGNEYIDMSIMGIGTNILGYGHPEVDEAVMNVISSGNMSTFNCPEEVYLAEKLIEIHQWADMVRLARSGGEANAIAIRIARAATGKDNVAVCGYHGWHDWYLSANLGNNEHLAGHLLPGLEPRGVPQNLRGTVFPFNYNKFDELESIVNQHNIGVIKMEVVRNQEPKDNFLHKVRKLAAKRGIVLIFDECTSGFRETYGGLHKKYGVEPDIAMFGKALGNGYAITAIIGRREIMEAAQSSFISSTFWTERIGPVAALKTLEVMGRIRSWDTITQSGRVIRGRWQELADSHGLKISHWGLASLAGFTFEGSESLAYKTLLSQEMLSKGYLAGNTVYSSIAHTPEIIEGYFTELDEIFRLISQCQKMGNVNQLLKGPICHGGFKRLN